MNTPGIEVRPLVQITGAAHFNEVFLSDVRIPHENILGGVNTGWGPIMTTLSNERALIGGSNARTRFGEMGDLVMAMNGAAGMLHGASARDEGRWQYEFLGQWASRIGGGTDNIQRNTIGEKVLGLPPDIRVDKGVPFREIPS